MTILQVGYSEEKTTPLKMLYMNVLIGISMTQILPHIIPHKQVNLPLAFLEKGIFYFYLL